LRTKLSVFLTSALLVIVCSWSSSDAEVRIKDIISIENSHQVSLIGYGLVVGLDGTGDRTTGNRGAIFTVQSISNMLDKFGLTVPNRQLRTRNVAAIMLTAQMPPFSRVGSQFDVTVASLGDATSLEGGVLLVTPLLDPSSGNHYGMAQGPISVGGFNIETPGGEKLKRNHALVGRVPGGGYLTATPPNQNIDLQKPIRLFLIDPDFMTAKRIADQINETYTGVDDNSYAQSVSPGVVELSFPEDVASEADAVQFIAGVETLLVQADVEARVVINERSGTIVAGGMVTIDEVMISHGNLTIHTMSTPVISQPQPFSSGGQTVVAQVTRTSAEEETAKNAVIQETATVSELASSLNALGLKPRDIIAIFQAIKQAGALRAKLIIN